ncbi:Homeotic protein caudal [Lucilia cuprina]|uniref:Homeotic protein caudal n=1 Tax=Lucilia cuprina TaxID=7375 RepID=A0A0L0BWX1_LUCCU|nr:Homeotic protein caudal [Lucilia cuprina]
MVSYYNTLSYPQKHSAANLAYSAGQPWQWTANYHTPPNHQYLGDMDSPHAAHHQMYYNPHAMFHSASNAAAAASEWHSPSSAENFAQNAQMLQQQHQLLNGSAVANGANGSTPSSSSGSSTSTTSAGPASGSTQLNETVSSIGDQQQQQQHQQQQSSQQPPHITEGLPSPPITVSGSEISSPGAPASSSSPHHIAHHLSNNNNSPSTANNNNNNNTTINNNHRSSPIKSHQYYEWMKKPSYPAQPAPGKTRTKDKYRVVYTDFQRLELEKEYCTSRYITIRRKTELAQSLSLSERQVKIWFQNRRAKERKQNKKVNEPTLGGVQHPDYANLMDTKPKLEPGLHLQHSLHSINSMAMSMPAMRLHPHLHGHPLAVSAHSHHLQQSPHAQISAAAVASVGSLAM